MTNPCSVLIVEDDPYILKLCTAYLEEKSYRVIPAEQGKDALRLFYEQPADIILLDLGLPDMDGMELIPLFRTRSPAPVLVISARSEESEKIRALDLGADDYISKPFHVGELMARIRVAQRRLAQMGSLTEEHLFSCGSLRVDFDAQLVWVDGAEVHLTPIEFRLLKLLIRNRGKVLTHNYIQTAIWGNSEEKDAQNLRVFMANLRRKIERKDTPYRYILTQVGIGYRFNSSEPPADLKENS